MTIDAFDVSSSLPGGESAASWPLGNGEVGLNVWFEPNGDLCFYLARTDAWSELARLLKIGKMRVSFGALDSASTFEQRLSLGDGTLYFQVGTRRGKLWVDAHASRVNVEIESEDAFEVRAQTEIWRTAPHKPVGPELHSANIPLDGVAPVPESADVLAEDDGRPVVMWWHHNEASVWRDNMELQGLADFAKNAADPLLGRTFGAAVHSPQHGWRREDNALISPRATYHELRIEVTCAQTATTKEFTDRLDAQVDASLASSPNFEDHRAWWSAFWDRSWIVVGNDDQAHNLTRQWVWARYMAACAGRGGFPIKFNGSLFTAQWKLDKEDYNADYRRWGGGYWFQNTRLTYWPMLASGDFELMEPFFRLYREMLPLRAAQTRVFYGHEGAFYPETVTFWGTYLSHNYGLDRQEKAVNEVVNRYIRYHWTGALELCALALAFYDHTRDERFATETLLPLCEAILDFYALHFAHGEQLRITPASPLESWPNSLNPTPDVAGLIWVLEELSRLGIGDKPQRAKWETLRSQVPAVPMREGVLDVAQETHGEIQNSENPDLYAVFPFRLFGIGLGKDNLAIGRRTFAQRRVKGSKGWRQDDIQAATLGLAEDAKALLLARFAPDTVLREPHWFPGFWGPNFDWIPDGDHTSVGAMALQTMLLQSVGDAILLLPAWPHEWDVEFRLHAPQNTIVTGVWQGGIWQSLEVSPPERAKDVILNY